MDQLERAATEDLIRLYEEIRACKDSQQLKETAEEVYLKYLGAIPLLSRVVGKAVTALVGIAYPHGITPPSEEEARQILDSLRRHRATLSAKT